MTFSLSLFTLSTMTFSLSLDRPKEKPENVLTLPRVSDSLRQARGPVQTLVHRSPASLNAGVTR